MKNTKKVSIVNWTNSINSAVLCLLIMIAMQFLIGCAGNKEKIFGEEIPTMKAMHDQKFNKGDGIEKSDAERKLGNNTGDLNDIAKDTYDQLRQEFKFLPNPILTIYIYPHLTSGGRPVPGYSSYFKFYQEDQYALPGEAGVQ